MSNEPLLTPPENKYDYYNIKYKHVLAFGKKQEELIWDEEELDFSKDKKHYDSLPENVKVIVDNILGFFFASDGIVFEADKLFSEELKLPEARYSYTKIESMELTHSRSYGLQLDVITGNDKSKKYELMNSIENNEAIKRKAQFCEKYTDKVKYSFGERLIAFLCVEGVFFSSSFAFMFWLRKQYPDELGGIIGSNTLINRDEGLHVKYSECLYSLLVNKPSVERVLEIFKEALEIEYFFNNQIIQSRMNNMNIDLMIKHINSVANNILVDIGIDPLFPSVDKTPFDFMDSNDLETKGNFFENKELEYQAKLNPNSTKDYNKEVDF